MPLIQASLGTDPVMLITLSRNSSVDEISERYNLNYDIVAVKLFHPYKQFTRNVRLSRRHRRSQTFSTTTNNLHVTFAYLIDIVAVNLFHPYEQFTRNVRLSRRHRRSKPFPPLRTIYT